LREKILSYSVGEIVKNKLEKGLRKWYESGFPDQRDLVLNVQKNRQATSPRLHKSLPSN